VACPAELILARGKPHTHHHKDGSLWARGQMLDGQMHGPWEFFRKDGTKLRSGSFDNGEQTGEWTTYDKAGKPYKTTLIKPKPRK
jgi:antitoxin component YwqK of YwqJK toxin-antitoxin module